MQIQFFSDNLDYSDGVAVLSLVGSNWSDRLFVGFGMVDRKMRKDIRDVIGGRFFS